MSSSFPRASGTAAMKTTVEKTARFLVDASLIYRDTCPELSRYLLQWCVKAYAPPNPNPPKVIQSMPVCPCCYQWRLPGNHRMRLRPKQRPPARIQSVLRRRARGKRLSLLQNNLLQRFEKSCSVLMATCHTCNTTTRHRGMNRDFISTLAKTQSTPRSAAKRKTPQSANKTIETTPKTPGKDTKTPVHSPRSSTPSSTKGPGSSSSKPTSKPKNWVVQRLSKILMREDNQSSKKGGLKDFLSSL